jgi:hypothetical protein
VRSLRWKDHTVKYKELPFYKNFETLSAVALPLVLLMKLDRQQKKTGKGLSCPLAVVMASLVPPAKSSARNNMR